MNQVADIRRLYAFVLQQAIDTTIGRHHRVEHAWMRIGIELDKDFGLGHV
jgi:hypothetical protein